MNSTVEKICTCSEAKWPKCPHPWYMKKFRWQGAAHKPNLTRYARVVLQTKLVAKTDAEKLAESVRTAIRLGSYESAKLKQTTEPVRVDPGATLAHSIDRFDRDVIKRDVLKSEGTKQRNRANLDALAAFTMKGSSASLGEQPLSTLTVDALIAFRNSSTMLTAANSTWAKYRTVFGQFTRWAKGEALLTDDLLVSSKPDLLKLLRRGKGASRTRRVDEREESALLRAAGRVREEINSERLRVLIIAAIETGMRQGELLALQWGDVHFDEKYITVRAVEEGARKTGASREVPLSQRLADELQGVRVDPAGKRFGRTAYVFGDAIGGRVKKIRKAWESTILRAHGADVTWTKTALSPASRAKLDEIDLHFHDLRHEAGSRWLESKLFDIGEISVIYGHKTIAQTAAYLHTGSRSPRAAMARLDAARAAEAATAKRAAAAESRRGVPKLSQNGRNGGAAATGPRLVKGAKSRGKM